MRWVVGDIQGCALELERLLSEIRFDPVCDEFWSVGDIVNRGPDSLAAMRLWLDTGGRGVLGNHDVYAIRAFADRTLRRLDTLDGLFDAPDAAELIAKLRDLPLMVRVEHPAGGRDAVIVHAGVHPRWKDLDAAAATIHAGRDDDDWLESDGLAFATRVRCCDESGRMVKGTGPPEECPEGYRPWDAFYQGPDLIVHGHWARRGYYRTQRTLGLDSGCVYGGELTAWCLEEDRIVSVPSGR